MLKSGLRMLTAVIIFAVSFAIAVSAAFAAGPQDIRWNEPVSWAERLDAESYILPAGWDKATEGVDEFAFYNAGGLAHDIATYINMKMFEQLTGIHVRAITVPERIEYAKTLSILVAGKSEVPLLLCPDPVKHLSSYAVGGWLTPLDFFYPPEVLGLYSRALKDMYYIRGHWWAAPETCIGQLTFYRPSWLQNAGVDVPSTWTDLYEAAQKCRTWGKQSLGQDFYGAAFGGTEDLFLQCFYPTVRAQGGEIWKDGKFHFLDPKVVKAFKYWVDLIREDIASQECLNYTYLELGRAFGMGKAAFGIQLTTAYAMKLKTEFPEVGSDYGVLPPLKWSKEYPDEYRAGWVSGNAGIINKKAPPNKQAAALLFLDYLRSRQATRYEVVVEGNETFFVMQYADPDITKKVDWAFADRCADELDIPHPARIESIPAVEAKKALMQYGTAAAMPPGFPEILTEIVAQLGKASLGKVSVEEACKSLQQLGDDLVK